MAQELSACVWSVADYVRYPVHVSDLQRAIWSEERENALTQVAQFPKYFLDFPGFWRRDPAFSQGILETSR